MDIGAIFRQSEMNRISDITYEEVESFEGDLGCIGVWYRNIAIPFFTVNVHMTSPFPPYSYIMQATYRQLGYDSVKQLISSKNIGGFDPEKPIIECFADMVTLKMLVYVGTPKVEEEPGNSLIIDKLYCNLPDNLMMWPDAANPLIYTFSYINCMFLTQPPRKGKTRIEKTHETLLNGQVISHPQKVTFYQLPDPEQINHRKIAAYQREWHCPAWGVRGHYRHYKSGKVVFIKSYVKGKDKSKYEGREYDIGLVTEGGRICY